MGNPVNEALLELTKPQRKNFKFDGTPYEFRDRDELSLVQIHRMDKVASGFKQGISTDDEAVQQEAALDELLNLIIVDGEDLIPALGYRHKQAILESFLARVLGRTVPTVPVPMARTRRIRSK